MTVNELRALLEDFDGETPVAFAHNYGDYRRTQVAATIHRVEEGKVKFSDYHRMDAVVEEDVDDEEYDALKTVVLLS